MYQHFRKICGNAILKVNKTIPVTGHGGLQGFETSMMQHFLDNQLTDGGEDASFMRRQRFIYRKVPGARIC
jgi:hypothetical protein